MLAQEYFDPARRVEGLVRGVLSASPPPASTA
jgi:hypothetical protein